MLKKRGFTFIEVMIVIAVFSIGVLAVLRLVIYNMSAVKTLETRTTATFLAKEGIELAYNLRDSNLAQ
jgi:prepilin-type N-terminal cleavage/methylation domain-containing protein